MGVSVLFRLRVYQGCHYRSELVFVWRVCSGQIGVCWGSLSWSGLGSAMGICKGKIKGHPEIYVP